MCGSSTLSSATDSSDSYICDSESYDRDSNDSNSSDSDSSDILPKSVTTVTCLTQKNHFSKVNHLLNFINLTKAVWYINKVTKSEPPPTLFILFVYASLLFGWCHKSNAKLFFSSKFHSLWVFFCLSQGCLVYE